MISYKIFAKDGQIEEEWKLSHQTKQRDVAYMVYCMQQKINLLMSLEFDNDLEVKYDIDENGDPVNQDEDEGQ